VAAALDEADPQEAEVIKEMIAPKAEEAIDPLLVPMADLTSDERIAWVEAFRAKVMLAKTSIGMMETWNTFHERQIKPLAECDAILAERLETWFGERLKRLRNKEASPG
jgi:hypothetical protein